MTFGVPSPQISRKGSRDVADHMAIQMDDSDSITVSEQSEPSAECWQNMYKLLNFYSLISDPTGILEKSSPENGPSGGSRPPAAPCCRYLLMLCFSVLPLGRGRG